MTTATHRPVRYEALFILVLATLSGIGPLSIDMYLPAMPAIARDLVAGPGAVQISLSAYMVGLAGGMLFWGPIGDRFGRRGPMVFGLVLYVAASLACATAPNVEALVVFRVMQAAGCCAVGALGQAAVADVYERDRSARVYSIINTVFLGAPLVAPTLGSALLELFGWRSIFLFLAASGMISIAGLALLPETLPAERRRQISVAALLRTYGEILTHRRFLTYASLGALFSAGLFAYISSSPFVYIEYFGVAPRTFGLIFATNVLGMMAMSFLNSRLVTKMGSDWMLRLGLSVCAFSGVALVIGAVTGIGGLYGVAVPIFCFVSVVGLIGGNAAAGALAEFRQQAGAAASLMGASGMGAGALAAALIAAMADGTPRPMALVMCGAGLTAAGLCRFGLRRRPAA